MDVAVLFSGAKDSTFAVYKAMLSGMSVRYLVTMIPEREDSMMFNHPNIRLAGMQAEALGIPIITKETSGLEGEEMEDLEEALAGIRDEIRGVVTGVLSSQSQKARIDSVCESLGLECVHIAWDKNAYHHWEEIIKSGFRVIMSRVSGEGMGKEWLGKEIGMKEIKELTNMQEKFGTHSAGEGGEFETFVFDGPVFRKRIDIRDSEIEWTGVRGSFLIKDAELAEKSD